jgi:anaerobic magnesium-protoporphyrin IX monomethyl ester cyclase
MKKIILLIPPAYERDVPSLGTAALAGFLKSKGMEVRQMDLNILYFDSIGDRLEELFSPTYRDDKIRKNVYYHPILRYQQASGLPDYFFENNPGSSFAFTEKILSSRVLYRYLADEEENPFVRFFAKDILPSLRQENPGMVGFSITAPSQVIATFTFCQILKREIPGIRIVLGGQWVSLYREALQKRKDFLRLFDFMIYFEGETPLYSLMKALDEIRPLRDVPNLIYPDHGRWKKSTRRSEEDLNSLPPPDFDGLPLTQYHLGEKRITVTCETARGCYWDKCIFCVDLPLPKSTYREKSVDLVIRDMNVLMDKYGAANLIVSNAVYAPWQMREVSKRMIEGGIKIAWWAFARFDPRFDRETLQLAKESGCTMMGFGLESINQRVLDFIKKGTRTQTIKRILLDLENLGLPFFIQTMLGLPSERIEEALETIEFLAAREGVAAGHAAFNIYYLTPKNEVFINPGKYGIAKKTHGRLPFRFFYPFSHVTGNIHEEMANKMIQLYNDLTGTRKTRAPGREDS